LSAIESSLRHVGAKGGEVFAALFLFAGVKKKQVRRFARNDNVLAWNESKAGFE